MLVEMLPEQVSENWGTLRGYIAASLPPIISYTEQGMSNVLRSALFGDLKVFVFYEGDEENKEAIFVLSGLVQIDRVSLQRAFLIYSFTRVREIKPRHWEEGFEQLRRYAEKEGCGSIIAYSENQQIIDFLSSQGARTDFTLIEMEV